MLKFLTVADVKRFQRRFGLVVDGIAGPQTKRVWREVNKTASKSARKEPIKTAINQPLGNPHPVASAPNTKWAGQIAIPDTARAIDEIIFHCAATPEGKWFDRVDINAWHKKRGFVMNGYHFVITLDGTIQIGRPIGMTGAHVADHNEGSIGIVYIGGLSADGKRPKDTRTSGQMAAAEWLIRTLRAKYRIKRRVRGHNEYDAGKACPSFKMSNDILGAL